MYNLESVPNDIYKSDWMKVMVAGTVKQCEKNIYMQTARGTWNTLEQDNVT